MTRARRDDEIRGRDAEDLEEFAARHLGMAIHGSPMEPAGSPTYETPTFPHWLDSYSASSNGAMFRAIWKRLTDANELYPPASTILVALHSPEAVACDGKTTLTEEEIDRARRDKEFRAREQLDVGRRIAVYPCTETAARVRGWARLSDQRVNWDAVVDGLRVLSGAKKRSGPHLRFRAALFSGLFVTRGRSPSEVFTAIAQEAGIWRAIDAEAQKLIRESSKAWNRCADHRAKRANMLTGMLDAEHAARDFLAGVGR
jgi:hypothetical protein